MMVEGSGRKKKKSTQVREWRKPCKQGSYGREKGRGDEMTVQSLWDMQTHPCPARGQQGSRGQSAQRPAVVFCMANFS